MKSRLVILVLIMGSVNLHGQSPKEVCKYVNVGESPVLLDSLSVWSESIRIEDEAAYHYDINTGLISFDESLGLDSVRICYTTFPFNFAKSYYKRSLQAYDSNAVFKAKIAHSSSFLEKNDLFTTENISKSGMITRGVSFGNRQNVFVNSSLNLNLDGELTDGLNIRAAITDQNIPFQPEGNTQQLQDFDNVFIELYNDRFSLVGGDVVLKNKPSNFLKYYKNVQGASLRYQYDIGNGMKAETGVNIAQAKGKFASILIEVQDGISGPYKIPGPEGQRFVIVIANSEKVFVDGQLLERGYNHDYTIDYNLGEITFTPEVLITQYSRVRVDYEIADQNYARTISSVNHSQQMGKWSFQFNHYSEKDNRNRSLANVLSDDDKQSISDAGDNPFQAIRPSFDSVAFTPNEVLYKKENTMDSEGNPVEMFVHSTNPDSAYYRVRFNDVGLGNGNYILKQITANGRVYEWINPVMGTMQGQYEPIEILAAPNKRQMTTAQLAFAISEYDSVYTEFAYSDHDQNLYSDIDDDNNKGMAVKTGYVITNRPLSFSQHYLLSADFSMEYDDKYFAPIDRFRAIEYDRNWSYSPEPDAEPMSDLITGVNVALIKDTENQVKYGVVRRERGSNLNGFQHDATWNQSLGQWRMKSDFFSMNSKNLTSRSNWQRLQTDISWRNSLFTPGYIYRFDKNILYYPNTDSIVGGALNYDEHVFYLTNREKSESTYRIEYGIREDRMPNQGEIIKNTNAQTLSVQGETKLGNNQQLKSHLTYRKVSYHTQQQEDENMLGRIDWQAQLLDNHIRPVISYSMGTGRELKREFVYIQVPIGQGTHAWRDISNDGIQDVNEFFIAINPDEKQFVKMFVPTSDYINAYTSGVNANITADMPRDWRAESGIKRVLSGFSNMTSWIADSKVTDGDFKDRFFAFASDNNNEYLLSNRSSLRSVFFFNRSATGFGAEGGIHQTKNQQLLTSGTDISLSNQYHSTARWNIQRIFTVKLGANWGDKSVSSDYLDDRNYRVNQKSFAPSVAWQPGSTFRLTGKYSYAENIGQLASDQQQEYLTIHNTAGVEIRYSKLSKGTFSADVRYIDIQFEGEENSALGYELLNALRPGENITWNANFILKFTSGIQLQLNYEGRKSPGLDVVNIGRMQVSALF